MNSPFVGKVLIYVNESLFKWSNAKIAERCFAFNFMLNIESQITHLPNINFSFMFASNTHNNNNDTPWNKRSWFRHNDSVSL